MGEWAQAPIPNPQSPIPNPHYEKLIIKIFLISILNKNKIYKYH
jgi:hypothetical protein